MIVKRFFQFFLYCGFRVFGFFISLLPYPLLHAVGRKMGVALYYVHLPFRKKSLTNLMIAFGTRLSEERRIEIAKESFQNLAITCLELFRVKKSKGRLSEIVELHEHTEAYSLMKQGQGFIFLSGHQANWEIPFIALTEKHEGIAIGRPIKNLWLYKWILSIREMHGGTIVMPRNAIRQGIKVLKEGKFIGIVGDQAFPESAYSYPLFGTRAWTTTAPALLAYRTNSPIVVAMTARIGHRYVVKGSSLLWPDLTQPREQEVVRLMDEAMAILEKSIEQHPGQWMWQHDRWKQQGIDHVKREYRFGFVLIVLPPDPAEFLPLVPLFREIYPRSFLTFFVPEGTTLSLEEATVLTYKSEQDLFVRDWRYQLVLDFYDSPRLRRHFLKLGAFKALHVKKMKKISKETHNLKMIIQKTLVKSSCLPTATT